MQILKVWDSEYPWDVRAEKVCQALTAMGHEVHLVARNRDRRPLDEALDECTVHRMRPWVWAGSGLDAASQFPAFFNPRWARLIRKTGRRFGVHAILVRDLPLAPTALRAGRRLGVPVVLDMAENYPAMMRDLWITGSARFGDFFVRNPRVVQAVERSVLARMDHILVVVEESRERLVSMGIRGDAISIVGNTPALGRVDEFARIREAREECRQGDSGGNSTRLVYLGLMEEARGVGILIQAVAAARDSGTPITLDLIGDGRALPAFRSRAAALGLTGEAVRFHGFLPYREALTQVALADAGLIPHYAHESWETTIPNKLFDYMSLGLPIIASDVTPVRRVLGETGAGVTFRDRDSADLTRVLRTFHEDPGRSNMGRAGIQAVRTRYHWEQDAERLHAALRRVVGPLKCAAEMKE